MSEFKQTVDSLFKGMDGFMSSKTVVGEPIIVGNSTLIPLVDVSFGVAAGAFDDNDKKKAGAGGGMGGKMSPSAVLVIQEGNTRLVSLKNQDSISKLIDMVPEFVDKFTKGISSKLSKEEKEAAVDAMADELEKSMENAK